MKQQTFASLAYQHKKKRTRREVFLAEMDAVVAAADRAMYRDKRDGRTSGS